MLLLLEVSENHNKKENTSVGSDQCTDALFGINLRQTDFKHIWIDSGSSEFLNIHIFNWYESLFGIQ